MKHLTRMLMSAAALAVLMPAAAQAQHQMAQEDGEIEAPSVEQVEAMVAEWPETPRKAATTMIEKYGAPDGVTSDMIVWNDNGPWKQTIVYSEPIQHDFPIPHEDVLEQFILYDVPADMFDELARFDGSVIVERTKGVISARCDKEGANLLALNLANDIVNGDKTVEEARREYGETIKAKMNGESPKYMAELQFEIPKDTGDADETTIDVPMQGQDGAMQRDDAMQGGGEQERAGHRYEP